MSTVLKLTHAVEATIQLLLDEEEVCLITAKHYLNEGGWSDYCASNQDENTAPTAALCFAINMLNSATEKIDVRLQGIATNFEGDLTDGYSKNLSLSEEFFTEEATCGEYKVEIDFVAIREFEYE